MLWEQGNTSQQHAAKIYNVYTGSVVDEVTLASQQRISTTSAWDANNQRFVTVKNNTEFCVIWYADNQSDCETVPNANNVSSFHWLSNDSETLLAIVHSGYGKALAIIKVNDAQHSINYGLLRLHASNPGYDMVAVDSDPSGSLDILMNVAGQYTRKYTGLGPYAYNFWSSLPTQPSSSGGGWQHAPSDQVYDTCQYQASWMLGLTDYMKYFCDSPLQDVFQLRPTGNSDNWRSGTANLSGIVYEGSWSGGIGDDWACGIKSGNSCDLWMVRENNELVLMNSAQDFSRRIPISSDFVLGGAKAAQ